MVVLNDGNISMLARNAVMLHMLAEQRAPADAVLAVWANHALTDTQHQLMLDTCRAIAEGAWPAWLSAATNLAGVNSNSNAATSASEAEAAVRDACRAWASCTMSLQQLLQERDANLGNAVVVGCAADRSNAFIRQSAIELSLSAVAAATNTTTSGSSSSSTKVSKRLQKEITDYINTGSLQLPEGDSAEGSSSSSSAAQKKKQQQQRVAALSKPNLTLLTAELQYSVYFSSSVFRAVQLPQGHVLPATGAATTGAATSTGESAADLLLAAVAPQFAAAAEGLRQGRLRVVLLPGDILAVALQPAVAVAAAAAAAGDESAEGCLFDFIDTSNVSDYT